MRCTVRWFDAKKGYGVIVTKDGKEEYFVHQSTIVMDGFRYLNEDDIVDFNIKAGENGRNLAVDVTPVLTRKMIEEFLKEENLYVQTMKDSYGVTKYLVVDKNKALQTDEQGMSFLELAEYAGFEIRQASA